MKLIVIENKNTDNSIDRFIINADKIDCIIGFNTCCNIYIGSDKFRVDCILSELIAYFEMLEIPIDRINIKQNSVTTKEKTGL